MSGEVELRRFFVPAALLLVLFPAAFSHASPIPEIVNIHGQVKDKEAKVFFTLRNAFTPEMVEALKSGIEISFRTTVRIERVHRNWFDTPVGEITFTRSVRYDALSRVYRLHKGRDEELLPDVRSALSGMTNYELSFPLNAPPDRGKPYVAHVRTRLDKVGLSEPLRSIFFFSSLWDVETEWAEGRLAAP